MRKIKIGLLGAGHLGKIHLRLLKEIADFEVIGFYDANAAIAAKVEEEFNVTAFRSAEELISACEAIDIVTPTIYHFQEAQRVLAACKHLFIEKPVTSNSEEAKVLQGMAIDAMVKIQIGHVERFNPAYLAASTLGLNPMFIETHRLAEFNPRGTDVPVVLDLMIHDIDIMLHLVKSKVKSVSASGVAVISNTPDIANARIEFENGCTANLTASRISINNMRKTRLFQKDAYISIDFLSKKIEVFSLHDVVGDDDASGLILDLGEDRKKKKIEFVAPPVLPTNAIKTELELFAKSILNDTPTSVTIDDGVNALVLAEQIMEKVAQNSQRANLAT